MAVDSYNPTTGRPIFLDTGAPDVGVDPTEVGVYAADVGNRIVRANLAALEAYAFKRAGLMGHALDTKREYVHDGSGWMPLEGGAIVPLGGFGANWSATAGYSPFMLVQGSWREIYGAATRGAGGALTSILNIPAGHYPTSAVFIGSAVTSSGTAYVLNVSAGGVLNIPYGGGSSASVYPLIGRWKV